LELNVLLLLQNLHFSGFKNTKKLGSAISKQKLSVSDHELKPRNSSKFIANVEWGFRRQGFIIFDNFYSLLPEYALVEDLWGGLHAKIHLRSPCRAIYKSSYSQLTIQALWNKLYSSSGLQGLVLGCGILILYMATTPLFQCDKMPAFASTPQQPELLLVISSLPCIVVHSTPPVVPRSS
jgi:hypothetical protein